MRILHLNYEYPPIGGGGGIVHKTLVDELSKQFSIDVITSKYGKLARIEGDGKVNIYRVSVLYRTRKETASLLSMVSYCISGTINGVILCKKKKYTILHSVFVIPSGVVGIFLSKLYGLPHVLTLVGGDIYDPTKKTSPDKHFFMRWLVRWMINNSEVVIAATKDIAERTKSIYRINKNIHIIPWAFKPPEFKIDNKSTQSETFNLIAVGRLVKRKGLNDLLNAVARLSNRQIQLIIIGDGPEKQRLKILAKQLDIQARVKFTGYVSERKKYFYLTKADCFVLPSIHEGFGLVFLEAMHCGLPIIATNEGGQVDFLKDNKTGFLVRIGDPDQLAKIINKMMDKNKLRSIFSRYNRALVKEYAPEMIADQYVKVYAQLINRQICGKKLKFPER